MHEIDVNLSTHAEFLSQIQASKYPSSTVSLANGISSTIETLQTRVTNLIKILIRQLENEMASLESNVRRYDTQPGVITDTEISSLIKSADDFSNKLTKNTSLDHESEFMSMQTRIRNVKEAVERLNGVSTRRKDLDGLRKSYMISKQAFDTDKVKTINDKLLNAHKKTVQEMTNLTFEISRRMSNLSYEERLPLSSLNSEIERFIDELQEYLKKKKRTNQRKRVDEIDRKMDNPKTKHSDLEKIKDELLSIQDEDNDDANVVGPSLRRVDELLRTTGTRKESKHTSAIDGAPIQEEVDTLSESIQELQMDLTELKGKGQDLEQVDGERFESKIQNLKRIANRLT